MNQKQLGLSQRHVSALRSHQKPVRAQDLRSARRPGRQAVAGRLETPRAARWNKPELKRLNLMLDLRAAELTAKNRNLQRGIVRRQSVETALKISGENYAKLLKESLKLQKGLRHLTHQVLRAQETERKKISHALQDEIAQTLLGINVRLLTLKQEARTDTKSLKNGIASTQRLVVTSARWVRRFGRKLTRHPPVRCV